MRTYDFRGSHEQKKKGARSPEGRENALFERSRSFSDLLRALQLYHFLTARLHSDAKV